MAHYYNISFTLSLKDNTIIQDRIKQLGDSFNLFPCNWIVYSELTAQQLYDKISSEEFSNESIFIVKLDISSYWGRMNKSLWAWLKSHE